MLERPPEILPTSRSAMIGNSGQQPGPPRETGLRHAPVEVRGDLQRSRILLADDDIGMRETMQRLLSEQYTVEAAVDGAAALEAARREAPELILADVTMPGLNGFELLKELRADERLCGIPVILLSAREGEESRVEGYSAGADDYLTKPFSARELLARVQAHLRLKHLREETQAALRVSEERYRLLVRASSQVVVTADSTGANTDSGSDWWERLTGQPMSESANHGWTRCLHPDDYQPTVATWRNSIAAQIPFESEFRARRREGDYCWLHATGAPIRNADGSFREWAIALRDVSDRKRAEEALRESESRLRLAVEAARMSTWELRLDTGERTLGENYAEVFGSAPQTPGEFLEAVHPDDRAKLQQATQRAIEENLPYRLEYRVRTPAGDTRWLSSKGRVMRDEAGRPLRILGTVINITDRKRAKEDARLLSDLSERIRLADSAEELMWQASAAVGEYLQVRRCFFTEVDLEQDRDFIRRDYCRGVPSIAGKHKFSDYSSITRSELISGRPVINCDSQADPRTAALYDAVYSRWGERAYVGVPLLRSERLVGIFSVTTDQPHDWQAREITLLETVAERVWLAVEKLRLDRAVRESEARYRALVQASAQAVWRINESDPGNEAIIWWTEYTGQTREDLIRGGWLAAIHPDDRERTQTEWKRALESQSLYETTYRVRRHDGDYRWFTARGVPIFDAGGSFREWIGTLTDVHDQIMRERDTEFLTNLGEQIRLNTDPDELMLAAVQLVGDHFQVSRCFLSEVDEDADLWTVHPDCYRSFSMAGSYKISDYAPELVSRARAGQVVSVANTATNLLTAATDESGFRPIDVRAFILVPLLREGRWHSNLVVASNHEREWQSREIALLETVAERLWSAVERLRLDAAVRESEARLRLALEINQITIWNWDIQSATIRWSLENQGVANVLEFDGTLGAFARIVHPEDAEVVWATVNEALTTRTSCETEFRILRTDGEVRWLYNRGIPYYDDAGRPLRMLGVVQDITERKLAEVKLRRANDRFSMAEEAANGWVYEWDFEAGVIERSENFYTLTGYTPEEVRPDAFWIHDLIHPEDRGVMNLPPDGNGYSAEYRLRCRNGRYIHLWDKSRLTRNAAGQVTRLIGRTVDITARKQVEQERERLLAEERRLRETAEAHNRAKDEFLSIVSHELRSPLNAVLGYARVARLSAHDAAEVQKSCEIIERNAKAQQQLIEDLLDTARIISGKLRLEVGQTDLRLVLEEALEVARPTAEAKEIELIARLGAEPQQVIGDQARLQQVVWNLLQNAIKFTAEGGRVELRLEADASQARIIVRDTGKGIEPEFLPSVFDRFTQQDASRTRRHGGLGLGLSLVKQLVEMHGGTIHAASDGVGRGATFTVALPLRQSPYAISYHPPTVPSREVAAENSGLLGPIPALEGIEVLMVDDQADVRQLLVAMLKECGARPTAVASGVEALAYLADPPQGKRPDVLILDIAMPDEDGYAVLQKVRTFETQNGVPPSQMIPAIALTAFGRSEDRLRALAAGFRMHLTKPVEMAELAVVIHSVAVGDNRDRTT